jgi:hypothetical protein
MVFPEQSALYPTDLTLGSGIRSTPITVTTTPTSLDALLTTAVAGRVSLTGRRSLSIKNKDASVTLYILESTTQTVTDGWEVLAGATLQFDASETFTKNLSQLSLANNGGGGTGFYLAVASGTLSAKVLEAR